MHKSSRIVITLSQHIKTKLEGKAEKNGCSTNASKIIILNLNSQFVLWDVFYRVLRVIPPKIKQSSPLLIM
jgi:hypothetical protein